MWHFGIGCDGHHWLGIDTNSAQIVLTRPRLEGTPALQVPPTLTALNSYSAWQFGLTEQLPAAQGRFLIISCRVTCSQPARGRIILRCYATGEVNRDAFIPIIIQ